MTVIVRLFAALAMSTMLQQGAATSSASIAGTVTEVGSRSGLARVIVALTSASGAIRRTVTESDGTYRFDALPAGRYRLVASKAGYLPLAYGALQAETPGPSLSVAPDQVVTGVDIALGRTAAVTGTIRDEHGRGVQGLAVRAIRAAGRSAAREHRALTDQQGAYRISGLSPGEYFVAVTPPEPARRLAVARGEAEIDWLLAQLERGVRDGFGQWRGERFAATPMAYGPTYFPGTVLAAAAATVTLAPGEERDGIDVSPLRAAIAAVTGVLQVPAGYDVSFAEVALVPRHAALHGIAFSATAFPPQGFKFGFDAVPPGPYVFIAMGTQQRRAEGLVPGALWAVQDIEIPASESFDLTVSLQPSGRLAGEVTTAGPSDDVETRGWSVRLEPHAPWLAGSLVGQAAATSGDDGRFTLGNLGPVQFDVAITHAETRRQGWRPQTAEAYASDVLDTPLTARPETEGQMAVTVTSEDARLAGRLDVGPAFSAADFHLVVFPRDPALRSIPNRIATITPAASGDYDVRGLPDGDYLVGLLVGPPEAYVVTPAFLDALAAGSVGVTLQAGTTVRQDIQFAGGRGKTKNEAWPRFFVSRETTPVFFRQPA